MVQDGQAPGSAGLQLAGGAPLLRPEEQVFDAMLEGWRVQSWPATWRLGHREAAGGHRGVHRHADAFPWAWTAQMLDEWLGDLRRSGGCAGPRTAATRWRCRRSAGTHRPGIRVGAECQRGSAPTGAGVP